jgi:predicted RNase H-like nuclease (RuvC/YqgF family)
MPLQAGTKTRGEPASRPQIERLEAQREEMDRELVRRAYRIQELEQELQSLASEFRTSFSWRLTAPLRAFKSLLGKLRQP